MLTAGRFVVGHGGEGGAECLEVLKSLDAVGVDLVSKVKTVFDEEGRLTDEAARERLRAFLSDWWNMPGRKLVRRLSSGGGPTRAGEAG